MLTLSVQSTPGSPTRTSITHKFRQKEDHEKDDPVDDQHRSFEAAGTESVKVNDADTMFGWA
jgi:hypothetical protein